jgi:hypothetical protein
MAGPFMVFIQNVDVLVFLVGRKEHFGTVSRKLFGHKKSRK